MAASIHNPLFVRIANRASVMRVRVDLHIFSIGLQVFRSLILRCLISILLSLSLPICHEPILSLRPQNLSRCKHHMAQRVVVPYEPLLLLFEPVNLSIEKDNFSFMLIFVKSHSLINLPQTFILFFEFRILIC